MINLKVHSQYLDLLQHQGANNISHVENLIERFNHKQLLKSPLLGDGGSRDYVLGGGGFLPEDSFVRDTQFILYGKSFEDLKDVAYSLKFLKAGP